MVGSGSNRKESRGPNVKIILLILIEGGTERLVCIPPILVATLEVGVIFIMRKTLEPCN